MPDEKKTYSGSLVLDLRIWRRPVHTFYWKVSFSLSRNAIILHLIIPFLLYFLSNGRLHLALKVVAAAF